MFLVTAAFVVFVPCVVHAAQKGALDDEKWLGACKLAAEFKKVQNRLVFRLEAPAKAATGYIRQLLRTKILIEKQKKGTYSKKEIALINYYAGKAESALQEASGTTLTALASALRNSAAAEAAIQEFINMLGQISDSSTHSCLEKNTGSNAYRPANDNFAEHAPGCVITTAGLKAEDTATEQLTPTGATTGLQGVKGSATASGTPECEFTQGKTGNKILNSGTGQNIAGAPKFAAGLFVMEASDLHHISTADLTAAAESAPLLHAAHAAYLLSKGAATDFRFKSSDELAEDVTFQTAFKRAVLSWKDGDPEPNNLGQLIKGAFGDKDQMTKTYKTDFGETDVPDLSSKTGGTKKRDQISSIAELQRLLSFYQAENIRSLTEEIKQLNNKTNQQKQATTESDATCEKKGRENNCKEGCKVEGKGNKESASMIRHTHQKKKQREQKNVEKLHQLPQGKKQQVAAHKVANGMEQNAKIPVLSR
uniref:Variant surface glycoprotein 1125.1240 n=1 Tax=Trypanosoma brucei TaxID=5691 RepID=A0A1J0R6T9_9TRYP|nr:variant surface glycoprotein 1125.1240 [Trypanosoma brucei]